jgi:hydroxyethylthiazole kinase-like sugar kinase family protein
MVDQKVAGHGCYPGHESTTLDVITTECAVHLDKDLLGQIVGVGARSGKAVANVVDATVVALDNLLPCHGVACNTATDQQSSHMGVFQVALPGCVADWEEPTISR